MQKLLLSGNETGKLAHNLNENREIKKKLHLRYFVIVVLLVRYGFSKLIS